MLTQKQKDYLETIPEDRIAHIVPFNPETRKVAHSIISEIESAIPTLQVTHLGSSKLGIAGENDIDLNLLGNNDFNRVLPVLTKLLGTPVKISLDEKIAKWNFIKDGFIVDIYFANALTQFTKKGLNAQHILEHDTNLLKEYERIKTEANGIPYREYVKRKWKFWDNILETKD